MNHCCTWKLREEIYFEHLLFVNSQNLEIRRFFAVLEKTSRKFKNPIHQITTISVFVVHAKFEWYRMRALGGDRFWKFSKKFLINYFCRFRIDLPKFGNQMAILKSFEAVLLIQSSAKVHFYDRYPLKRKSAVLNCL
jgi:hypothetical protein